MISAAYDLSPRAISGAPTWVDSQPREILARTPGEKRPTWDDQMAMLRKLLAERFNLSFHREKKQFNIYDFTVARDDPKLKATEAPPDEAPNMTSVVYPASSGGIDHITLPAHTIKIAQFAGLLNRAILHRPVVDNTGLSGRPANRIRPDPDSSSRCSRSWASRSKLHVARWTPLVDRVERPTDN